MILFHEHTYIKGLKCSKCGSRLEFSPIQFPGGVSVAFAYQEAEGEGWQINPKTKGPWMEHRMQDGHVCPRCEP